VLDDALATWTTTPLPDSGPIREQRDARSCESPPYPQRRLVIGLLVLDDGAWMQQAATEMLR